MAVDVYEIITNQIVELLETGTVPWHKPWQGRNAMPLSSSTGKPYRGINSFWLHHLRSFHGFESRYWLTYRQAQARGGHVRRGEKSAIVMFWKLYDRARPGEFRDDGQPVKDRLPVLRYYRVFNADQCEDVRGVPQDEYSAHDWEPIVECERVVQDMPNPPAIESGGTEAYYSPLRDVVRMPNRERFEQPEGFYASLFHELTHSTGHECRLNRRPSTDARVFGDEDYSREELIAEMGAAFLCGHCGIGTAVVENSAAYIGGWLKALRDDKRLVVQAAAAAQKAADFILSVSFPETSLKQEENDT